MLDAALLPAPTRVTTPRRLVQFMVGIAVLAALAACASLWAADRIRDAAQTIGRDAEPSVALALRMEATLGELDAVAFGDSLTDGGATIGTSTRFRLGLDRLGADIVAATKNITYGESEQAPIIALQQAVARYEEAVVEARTLGPGDLWLTSHRVQWASRVNRDFAVPQAEALAVANAVPLDRRYSEYRATSLLYGGLAFAAFALLTVALVAVQTWLAGRTRRLVNPPLAAATAVVAACGLWFGAAVLTERADLRAAKADAYDSLAVLFEAKAAANALRADTALWLLDPAARTAAQTGMDNLAHALIRTDLTRPEQARPLMDSLARALTAERDGSAAAAQAATPNPGGLLGAELQNITFGLPEREAATESIAELAYAEEVIQAVQTLEARREHTMAVVRWLDEAPRGGTGAFLALQAALDRTIAVNQSEFDWRVASALGRAALMPFVTTGALIATVLLAAGGLWLRLREYR